MRKKNTNPKHVMNAVAGLFAFMSEHPNKPQTKRVNAILELVVAIREEKRFDEKAQLIERLQEAFRRYSWVREILFTTEGPHEISCPAKKQTGNNAWEYGAIHVLLTLAEYYPDKLSNVRHCDTCGKWILALKSDHRFCSGNCRQNEYDNDPERIEQHRANMRRLYRLARDIADNAKLNVMR